MRAFLALDIPGKIKERIARAASALPSLPADIKWVKTPNLHITIKFIPCLDADAAGIMQKNLEEAAKEMNAVKLTAEKISFLSHGKNIRLIYLKLAENPDLQNLVDKTAAIASAASGYGADKKKFLPHITLGRVKRTFRGEKVKQIINSYRIAPFEWIGEEIVLFESILKPSGPLYRRIFTVNVSQKL